eukprot:scaffold188274_cov67-Cyclotella_meneghiniana.AAC.1
MNSGITYGHYKRGGQSIDTHRVVDTPRSSTLGMIVARGMEQKRFAPSHTPSTYLRYCVIATLNNCPPFPNSGIVLSKACAWPMQKEDTAGDREKRPNASVSTFRCEVQLRAAKLEGRVIAAWD